MTEEQECYKIVLDIVQVLKRIQNKTKQKKQLLLFQKEIINSKNPWLCYNFACLFKEADGIDIKALGKVIAESNNAEICYHFAMDIEKADIIPLWKIVKKKCDKTTKEQFYNKY